MKTIRQTEVVVIGAGAVGCSIAYHLAKRGRDVTLVDRGEPGSGTSGVNFGLVWAQSIEDVGYLELNIHSTQLWPGLVEELGEDVEYRPGGGLTLCLTEADYAEKAALLEQQRRCPLYQGRMLSPEAVFELQPGASRQIVGARWNPHDGDVNWQKWVAALERGCRRVGVHLLPRHAVTGIHRHAEGPIQGVETGPGLIEARAVVCAAGVWSAQIARMIDLHIDLKPIRGQILVTEPARILCPTPMSTVRQERGGRFFMGITREDVGFDWAITPDGYRHIRQTAPQLVPAVADCSITRHFAGLRPVPADGLPLLGAVEKATGFYMAVGHSGITLSPIHGQIISDLIIDGHTRYPIETYNPQRFDQGRSTPTKVDYL